MSSDDGWRPPFTGGEATGGWQPPFVGGEYQEVVVPLQEVEALSPPPPVGEEPPLSPLVGEGQLEVGTLPQPPEAAIRDGAPPQSSAPAIDSGAGLSEDIQRVALALKGEEAAKYADLTAAVVSQIKGIERLNTEEFNTLAHSIADVVTEISSTNDKIEPQQIVDAALRIAATNDEGLKALEQGDTIAQIKRYAELIRRLRR